MVVPTCLVDFPKHSQEPCHPGYGIIMTLMEHFSVPSVTQSLSHLSPINTRKVSIVIISILRGCSRGLEKFIKLPKIEYLPKSGVRAQLAVGSHQGLPNQEEMNYLP